MPQILVSSSFKKKFKKISTDQQSSIKNKISELAKDSDFLDIKKMHPGHLELYRLRIGKRRIIFKYVGEDTIELLKIDSRDKIYQQ